MKKLLGYMLPLVLGTSVALALTNPATFAPRSFPTQQTHYERHVINVTSSGCSADTGQGQTNVFTTGSCSVKLGTLPYNAFLARAYQQVTTACNASSTCTLALGTTSGGVNIVAAQSVAASGGGTALTIVAANLGITLTGNGATQTGSNGGFDLWATVAQTGTAASAGTIVVVLEFFNSNDGGCAFVPLGATAGAC